MRPSEPTTPSTELDLDDESWQALIESLPLVTYILTLDGDLIYVSPQIELMLGLEREHWLAAGTDWLTGNIHPDDAALAWPSSRKSWLSPGLREYRLVAADGRSVWVVDERVPMQKSGGAEYIQGYLLDVTERKEAADALRKSEAKLRSLISTVPGTIYRSSWPDEGVIDFVSQQVEDLTGHATTEFIEGKVGWKDLVHPDDYEMVERAIANAVQAHEQYSLNFRLLHAEGDYCWVHETGQGVYEADGSVLWRDATILDLTEHRRLEESYAQERHLMNTFLDTTTDGVYFKDRASRFIRISAALAARVGLQNAAQAIGKTDFDFFSEEHARPAYEDEQRILETAQPLVNIEEKETWEDGREAWVSTTKMPLRDEDGGIIGTYGISRDITARKRAEMAVQENQERMAAVMATQRDVVMSNLDLEAILSVAVERTQELTRADGAAVLLVDGEDLVVRSASGIASSQAAIHIPIASGIFSKWLAEGVPQRLDDLRADSDLVESVERRLIERGGARSLVCVPLQHGQETVGLLLVVAKQTHSFGEKDVDSLRLLAVVISAALSHAAEFEAKQEQVEALAKFGAMFEDAAISILMVEPDGAIIDGNPAVTEMLGYASSELVGVSVETLVDAEDRESAVEHFRAVLSNDSEDHRLELRYRHKNGEVVWGGLAVSVVRAQNGEPHFAIYMIENVTERKHAEEELRRHAEMSEYQALHDALTGLPNRTLFYDRVEQTLLTAEREGGRIALLLLDLDRFKEVNDTLGHAAGDHVLREVAKRLESCLRASDTVARLGGDEFGILLPKQTEPSEMVPLLDKLQAEIEKPIEIDGLPLGIEGSIGIAFYPDNAVEVEELMKHTDVAMYTAKQENHAYSFYERSTDTHDPVQLTLVGELRRAIDNHELVLYYQPKASFSEGTVDSVEALVRWMHPERGLLQPDSFIPNAQETGLMKPLTLYVLDEALRQSKEWRKSGIELVVSVNVGRRNMLDLNFPDDLAAVLKTHDADASWLELEVTESTMLDDPFRAKLVFERLDAMGVRISIDDYGTGYSSLAYLRDLPVSEIKIDRSFVLNMTSHSDDEMIVRSTIDLGRNLGLKVVAEGVETEEAWDRLAELGCDVAQGYLLTRPVPPEDLAKWLKLWRKDRKRPGHKSK